MNLYGRFQLDMSKRLVSRRDQNGAEYLRRGRRRLSWLVFRQCR